MNNFFYFFTRNYLLIFLIILASSPSYSQGYICAIGGGSEDYNDWSDAPYGWIVHKSDSGKIIIISYADASNWLPNYFLSLGAVEVYNKKIESRTIADMQSTYDELITADAIFIKGGDQWNYINLWKGTKTEEAIVYIFQNGGVVAGTSAGAAVLGDIDFTAKYGSAYPRSSLLNPLQTKLDFEDDFLDLQQNVIFDSHFIERARFGRLIPMLYKINVVLGRDIVGVGIDDRTALCITPDGIGEVMGTAAVALYYKDELTNFTEYQSGLYTIENLKCDQLTKGWKFNFGTREIHYIPPTAKQLDTLRTWHLPHTDFLLTGSNDMSYDINNSFNGFLATINNPLVVIFSHQSFSTSIQALTDYLNQQSIENHLILLSQSNLGNTDFVQQINSANAFVFAGDSLAVLSLLNQNTEAVPQAFENKINSITPCFFFGNSGKASGEFYINNTDDDNYAAYRGKLTNHNGISLFGELISQPLVFDDNDFYENRSCSVLWGLMLNRKRVGIYLDNSANLKFIYGNNSLKMDGNVPPVIVDARFTSFVDSSTYIASSGIAPRQVVAMNNLRYSITKYSGIHYLLEVGKFDNLVGIQNKIEAIPKQHQLNQNYPNPFNPETTIEFTIPTGENISLQIFDSLGRMVTVLADGYYPRGNYSINFKGNRLSSGVYFYRLETENYSNTKTMLLLK